MGLEGKLDIDYPPARQSLEIDQAEVANPLKPTIHVDQQQGDQVEAVNPPSHVDQQGDQAEDVSPSKSTSNVDQQQGDHQVLKKPGQNMDQQQGKQNLSLPLQNMNEGSMVENQSVSGQKADPQHQKDDQDQKCSRRKTDQQSDVEQTFDNSQTVDASVLIDHSPSCLQHSMLQTNYSALRDYLKENSQCEMVKKRVRILQKLEDHHRSVLRNQQKSQEHLENIRKEKEYHQTLKNQAKNDEQLNCRNSRENNQNLRQGRQRKIHEVFTEISHIKAEEYRIIKEQSRNYAHLRQQRQQGELEQKRNRRNFIISEELACKQNHMRALQEKRQLAKSRNNEEISLYQQRQNQKKKQLEAITDLQTEILKKSSVTRQQISKHRNEEASYVKNSQYSRHSDSMTPESRYLLHEFSVRMRQEPTAKACDSKKNQSWDLKKIYEQVFNQKKPVRAQGVGARNQGNMVKNEVPC